MRKAKYVHIIWHPDLKYIPNLIKMINDNPDFFDAKEHVFVTPHKRVYDYISPKYEIFLEGTENENLINRFGEYGDWLFVHAINCKRKVLIQTKKKYAKKVIWRTWGHDMRPYGVNQKKGLAKLMNYILHILYKKTVSQFRAIGIANDIDTVNVNDTFGKLPTMVLSYGYNKQTDKMLQIKRKEHNATEEFRIVVGHSRSPFDCHIDGMKKLEKYKDHNIKICLVLSYGGAEEYGEEVKKYAKEHFGEKVEFIEEFMNYEEYINYLSTIDAAVYPQLHSTALGNLAWLLHFGIPVFVRDKGQFAESFRRNNCEYCSFDSIDNLSYNEFVNSQNSPKTEKMFGNIRNTRAVCTEWKENLESLS